MLPMPEHADDDVEAILQSLPPAPAAWVARAEELPLLEQALGALGPEADEPALRRALRDVGLEPDDRRVHALARLRELRREG
jgi:hypothetical protein